FLNIGCIGFYDVVAFRLTRTHAAERWWYGAVAFAWSNFLTLGPFAGPAIRFWLYRPAVDHSSDLDSAVLSITIAFASGLIGWTIASAAVPAAESAFHLLLMGALAFACSYVVVYACRVVAVRIERFDDMDRRPRAALRLAAIGWTDWWLAFLVFVMCLRSTGVDVSPASASRSFFFGQAIGLA